MCDYEEVDYVIGGKFEIEIDGDLFKIIFSLPLANQLTIKE